MILQRCNIRLSNYVSNNDTKSYRKVVNALIEGKTSSYELVKLIYGRTINSHGQSMIREALEGDVKQIAESSFLSAKNINITNKLIKEIYFSKKFLFFIFETFLKLQIINANVFRRINAKSSFVARVEKET